MFGWSRGEALGRDLAETIIPAGQREAHRHGLQRFRRVATAGSSETCSSCRPCIATVTSSRSS